MMRRYQLGLAVLAGVGFGVRLPGLFQNALFADEALFATWARLVSSLWDPFLLQQPVDKPPLLFYLQSVFYSLVGPVEWAARLPNLMASVLLVPLVGAWAWRLYRCRQTAVLAAALLALCPYAVQFSPTAFLDPLLAFWLTASLTVTSVSTSSTGKSRPRLAGLLFGLALLTKYQAVLFLPLLLALGWWAGWRRVAWQRWLQGFVPLLIMLLLWDVARTGRFSLWSAQMVNYGGLRLIWSWEVWPRATAWAGLWRWVFGSWWLLGCFALALAWWLWRFWRGHTAVPDDLLVLFLLAYVAGHWLIAIPIWDRYLVPLLPSVAVIAARMVAALDVPSFAQNATGKRGVLWKGGLIVVLLLPAAFGAANGRFPVGGQADADQGAAEIAAYLADAPYGTVLYDHWWSWQWRYHLFDAGVYVSWMPHPEALAADLAVFGRDGSARYLALPETAAAQPFAQAVTAAGYRLVPVTAAGNIGLYLIDGSEPE